MSNYPTVADMLSIIGVALFVTVVLSATVGMAANVIAGRRRAVRPASVHPIPAQRRAHEDTTTTHAHAA